MFNIKNKFVLNSVVKNQTDNNNDDLILTGIASTTKEPSLYGEIMTEDALQQMCQQAVNLPILEAHKGDGFENVIGVITNAYVENNDLHIDFKILENHRQRIQELLDNNVPIGLSIGAQAMIDQDTQQVIGVTLIEVSITPVPANRVAHNTVRVKEDYYTGDCLHGICYAMIKDNLNMEDNNMVEEGKKVNPDVKEENDSLTIDKVKDMLDERFAEEKEVIVATVVEEVKTELKKLNDKVEETFKIEDAVKKEKGESKAKGESEGDESKAKGKSDDDKDPKADASGEEKPEGDESGEGEGASEEDEEDDKKKKNREIENSIEIDEDKIINSITERILDSLGEKRDVSGTKTEAALKNDSTEEVEEAKPFTSEEAAKLIINDMNRRDPLARAINEAINQ